MGKSRLDAQAMGGTSRLITASPGRRDPWVDHSDAAIVEVIDVSGGQLGAGVQRLTPQRLNKRRRAIPVEQRHALLDDLTLAPGRLQPTLRALAAD